MNKKRLPHPPDYEQTGKREPPPNAVWYHGYLLTPDAVERLKDVDEFHRIYGINEDFYPEWREQNEHD
ncbi:MAG: hypothetical protein ACI4UF_04405 [Thermoguttaceae bacterium]